LDFKRDPRSSADIFGRSIGLVLEHLALSERKFEQLSGFCGAYLSGPVSSSPSQLDSLSVIQSAIFFGTAAGMSQG